MMKKTIVVSAFPGKGKSYMTKSSVLNITDSDSSKFSWIYKNGIKTDERNPNFIPDYIDHIKSCIKSGEYDVIFVSSHEDVRRALAAAKIPYFLIYGYQSDKEDYLELYRERGNTEKFIENISSNYKKYVESMDKETFPIKIKLHAREFIDEDLVLYMLGYDQHSAENISLAGINKDNPSLNWTMISQNAKSLNIQQLQKFYNKLDWDLVSMYVKIPSEAYSRFPINKEYVLKYRKRYLSAADRKKLEATKKYK